MRLEAFQLQGVGTEDTDTLRCTRLRANALHGRRDASQNHGMETTIMENVILGPTVMENQMEKKMENEMETGIYRVHWG